MTKLVALLVLVWAASFARAESVLPADEGATWEYGVLEQPRSDSPSASLTVRVAGTEPLGGKDLLKLETRAGETLIKTELISIDDTGVHCFRRSGDDGKAADFDPPQTLVGAPLKPGATWELDDRVGGTQMHLRFTVMAEEPVDVPAGTYHAYRLHHEQPWPIATTVDRWFAPGIGFVKEVATTRGPTGRLLSRVTTELKKFSHTAPPQRSPALASPTPAAQAPPDTPESTPPPEPTPATPLKVTLEVASAREAEPQASFRSDAPNIFVRWTGVGLPVDGVVRVAWVAEDVGDVAPPNFIVDETETTVTSSDYSARFTLSRPRDGWAAGKYRVDLYVDDVLAQSTSVAISD